jgi:replicative DNA helicase
MSYIAEQQVIGSLLMDANCMSEVCNVLTPEMFTSELLGRVYHEFQRGYDNRYEVNIAVLEQKLRDENYSSDMIMSELRECINNTLTSAEIKGSASVVVNDYKSCRLDKFLSTIKVTPNNLKNIIASITQEIEQLQDKRYVKSKTLSEIAMKYKGQYFKDREVSPLYLGFPKLDNLLGGLEGGDMIVIGARPAVGKSAFVTQITSHLGKSGKRIGFYNLEMQDKQMYERFIVNESGLSLTRLKRANRFLGDEKERFDKANETLQNADNIIITSTGSKTVSEIRSESKNMDYDIIIIDYLQLLSSETTYRGNRTAEVGEISRSIKNLAMELNIPIIALSQLNRASEGKETKEPTMAELREAGNIEQDASVIILLWNLSQDDRSKKGCKIEKQRQGENGKVVMKFNGDLMRFEETEETVNSAREWTKADSDNPFV